MNRIVYIAATITVIALAVIAGVQVHHFFTVIQSPLIVQDTHILTPVVKFGDPVIITHTYRRLRYCKTDIDRFIIRMPDEVLVRRERLPAGTTLIGDNRPRTIQIPTKFPSQTVIPLGLSDPAVADLEVGKEYKLREFLHSECGDSVYTEPVPDIFFKVE